MAVSPKNHYSAIEPAKPRRRWLQFRLRSLLWLLAAAAAMLVAWRAFVEPYRRQHQTAQLIKKLGGRIESVPPPRWLPQFGHNLEKIVLIDVADRDDPAEYLEAVAVLPALETLVVGGPQFGDQQLRRLHGLETLRGLVLDSTEVTDAGLAEIQAALPAWKFIAAHGERSWQLKRQS